MIYLANVECSTHSGIFKKIESHARYFSKIYGECLLICKENSNVVLIKFSDGIVIEKENYSIKFTMKNIHRIGFEKSATAKVIYYRHMLKPSYYQLLFFLKLKIQKKEIIYEIPTYPYFKEQIGMSNNKILTICKLALELILSPLIYTLVSIIPIILSNSKKMLPKKFFLIRNGIEVEKYTETYRLIKTSSFVFVGVGTLYKYHGYDRLIKSISEYEGERTIMFKIIGDGPEVSELKKLVSDLKLEEKVLFLGRIEGNKLSQELMSSHMGVGSLTLFRRGANIDTTLKMVDYLCRGLPAITSGFYEENESVSNNTIYQVSNDLEMIDIHSVISFYELLDSDMIALAKSEYLEYYSWENILNSVVSQIGE